MSKALSQNLEKVFTQIGLTKEHAGIYSEILENHELSASEIYKKFDLKRSTVYDYLQKLKTLGLIDEVDKSRPAKYSTSPYQNLIDLIEIDLSDKSKALERAKEIQNHLKRQEVNKPVTASSANEFLTIPQAFTIIQRSKPKQIHIFNSKPSSKSETLIAQVSSLAKSDQIELFEILPTKPSSKLYISKYTSSNVHMQIIPASTDGDKNIINKYLIEDKVIYCWENQNKVLIIENAAIYNNELIEFNQLWNFYSGKL